MQNEINKLSDLINAYLGNFEKIKVFEDSKVMDIYSSWASIVGEKQAAHSKLIDIKHQTAIIETDHTGWSQQLLLNKRYIIRNFQKKYPQLEIKNISVIVSSVVNSAGSNDNIKPLSDDKPVNELKVDNNSETEKMIKNELPAELQAVFKRLQTSIIENTKSDKNCEGK